MKAVLFDAAGTLLHPHPSVGEIYAHEAARFRVHISGVQLESAFRDAWGVLRPAHDKSTPFHTSESNERAWWRHLVDLTFSNAGVRDAFGDNFDAFFDDLYMRFEQPDAWRLFDDVMPTLDALRARGLPCAIVSNWDSRLPRLLRAMEIADRFEFILTSAEAGFSKPAPEIFLQAVTRLAIPADQILYVGDSVDDDVRAAQRVGLNSVLIARNEVSTDPRTINNLMQILDSI